jgi:uncharacterized protein GlcG (DUF336 family)
MARHALWVGAWVIGSSVLLSAPARGNDEGGGPCGDLPGYAALKAALVAAVQTEGSGLDFQMWGTIVNRDGVVCVAFSGSDGARNGPVAGSFPRKRPTQRMRSGWTAWRYRRRISTLRRSPAARCTACSTVIRWTPMQRMAEARRNTAPHTIPWCVGAVGVSGDTSCADHMIAWRARANLDLDHLGTVVAGPAKLFASDPTHPDNIIYDITPNPGGGTGVSATGFGHPTCLNTGPADSLPPVSP